MAGHAGFDRSDYPGDKVMDWLKANTNLVWCGYYLGIAPSHPATSWMGKREKLNIDGWGIAPIYVGEQVIPPGSQNPSAAKGMIDGRQAAQLMKDERFPLGSCVYLDLEDGSLPTRLSEYAETWIKAVANGGFQPGVYCSHLIANAVNNLVLNPRIWAFNVLTVAAHDTSGTTFREDDPSGSGFANAVAWQLDQNAAIQIAELGGKFRPVDFSSSKARDPGAPVSG